MEHYYVSKKAERTGEHAVHKESCEELPTPLNREYLGYFPDIMPAIERAKEKYGIVGPCKICSATE